MNIVLLLLAIQGALGAFDTLYYHEWRARLPALGAKARPELLLHASRDFIYAVVFGTLPWFAWHGVFAGILALLFTSEIAITIADFCVEDDVRKSIGGVYKGERATHAIMGIIYGAMLANLIPILIDWGQRESSLLPTSTPVAEPLRWLLAVMAAGVFLSGIRDLLAAYQVPYCTWPWKNQEI